MKKLWLFFATALLSSCITVDDFGDYWQKGTIDSRLFGSWQEEKQPQVLIISKNDSMYRIDSGDAKERVRKDYAPLLARTLKVQDNTFLMICDSIKCPGTGDLIRYKITGDMIEVYILRGEAMNALLKEKYPHAESFLVDNNEGSHITGPHITKLNDEAFKILSGIPNDKKYWGLGERYRRIQ